MRDGHNLHRVRLRKHGCRDVAARADYKLRLELIDNLLHGAFRGNEIAISRLYVVRKASRRKTALKAVHIHSHEIIARLCDKFFLHSVGFPDKENLGFGESLAELIRNRKRGVDVTRSSSCGKKNVHIITILCIILVLRVCSLREAAPFPIAGA